MTKRMIHSNIWESEQVAKLSKEARLLYIGAITISDDDGRLKGNPTLLRSKVFPFDDDITVKNIETWLKEIIDAGLITYYTVGDEKYLVHPNWTKYQTLRNDRKKESNIPPPPDWQPDDNQVATKSPHKISKGKISKGKVSKDKEAILSHWNDSKIIIHKSLSKEADKEIEKALESYSLDEIKTAITVYATVLNGAEYWWDYKWNLYEFIKRGLKKFDGKSPDDYKKETGSKFSQKTNVKKI